MFIPRNRRLDAPSKELVLGSGLLTDKVTAVHAYRGTEPVHDLHRAPQGVLVVLTEGFAFVATSEQAIPTRALVQYFANQLTNHVPGAALPFGGVLTALLNGARDFTRPDQHVMGALEKNLDHPDTFVMSYVEIIETRHLPIGKFGIGRRDYTIVVREGAQGARESFCITRADGELADALLMLRFAAEKRTVRVKLLREQTNFRDIQLAVLQKYRAQFPSTLEQHREEIATEIMQRADAQLSSQGSSLERLDAMVLDELAHFRSVPQFTKYFAVAS